MQFDRRNVYAQTELCKIVVHHIARLHFDVRAFRAHNVEDGAVADERIDHRAGDVADRTRAVFDVELPRFRIDDAVLNDPFDVDDIQISREHRGFGDDAVLIAAVPLHFDRLKTELFRLNDLHRNIVVFVDAEGQLKMQTRADGFDVFAESRDDGLLRFIDDVKIAFYRRRSDKEGEQQRIGRRL